jgi:hypothetical protein
LKCLTAYAAVHLLLPLRHLLYPGNTNWTDQGQAFAWRLMLRNKIALATFLLRDPATRETWTVPVEEYLPNWQKRAVLVSPDMILQFAHHLAGEMKEQGHPNGEVHAKIYVSLNSREPELLFSPALDLAKIQPSLLPYTWLSPLTKPLPEDQGSADVPAGGLEF